jgi:hypothetical protein
MLKFTSFKRQEINLVFKIKVFVVSKIWYFNKSLYFYFPKIWVVTEPKPSARGAEQRRPCRHHPWQPRAGFPVGASGSGKGEVGRGGRAVAARVASPPESPRAERRGGRANYFRGCNGLLYGLCLKAGRSRPGV